MQRDVNVEVIEERVGDDLPRGWAWARLGSLVCLAQNGLSKRRSNEGVPSIVLRLADIRDGTISLENVRRIDLANSELEHYKLATNDVLCIRVNGSRNIVGRMIPCASVSKPVAFCDHFIRFGFTHGVILPVYLAKYFATDKGRRYIDLHAVYIPGHNTQNPRMIVHFLVTL